MRGRRVVVLTGAGCSTESGIPDYRGPETARRARNPIQYRDFLRSEAGRQRYWARSMVGWPRFRTARPNRGHLALCQLERAGHITGVITQNVDRLHHKAESSNVIELHGALAEVRCLACGHISDRDELQARLTELNPAFDPRRAAELAPDGDAELPTAIIEGFEVAGCHRCGGTLKPNVVFFGENVPRPVVDSAFDLFESAELLLVVGSSLTVFSGYRFVKKAHERGTPVAIVNLGSTRGDKLAQLCLDAPAGDTLSQLGELL